MCEEKSREVQMSELYQSTFVVLGIPAVVAIILAIRLRFSGILITTVFVALLWYIDGRLWSEGTLPSIRLSGIWGGLTTNLHILFLEAIVPTFLFVLWLIWICKTCIAAIKFIHLKKR